MTSRLVRTQLELGRLVRLHREHHGFATQEKLAEDVGTNRSAIAHLEQGLRLPDPELLTTICTRLSIPAPLWRGFRIRKVSAGHISVRCHSLVYYTSWSKATPEKKRRDKLVYAVKNNQPWSYRSKKADPYEHTARQLRKGFPELFASRTFVPVPKSVPNGNLIGDEWASLLLAQACAAEGDDLEISELIHRATDIRKSSDARSDQRRPTVLEHARTLQLVAKPPLPPGIVLVDDVVTRGATLVACAKLLRDAGWPGEIDALTAGYTKAPDESDAGEWRTFVFSWAEGGGAPRRTAAP